jgi:hypothetical protein
VDGVSVQRMAIEGIMVGGASAFNLTFIYDIFRVAP